ncbi:MAG: hypothetical protein JW779_05420 [Candidatus Thorarchaeota archaeon]|nr:hypothetical protein [Candidatus Thorarchaeota archaeon]
MAFGSKYFGWLLTLLIVLAGGWFLLPDGYNTLILWLSPQLGNYVRPTMVLVNAVLVNPLNNWIMVAIWAAAGFVGGLVAGTKKGAFVVGLFAWLSVILILVFCVYQLITAGFDLGTLPPLPPGTSITDLLSIPLVQSIFSELLVLIGGMSGGGLDILSILTPILIWLFTPVIVVIVAGIIGATVRPKE